MTIYEKLTALQRRLKVPKSKYNHFGEYNYRSLEDILEAVKPYLAEYRLNLVLFDDVRQVGSDTYIQAVAELHDIETDMFIRAQAFARETEEKKKMDASQLTGTASSYARKYALNGLFLLDDTKDADTDEFCKAREKAQARANAAVKPKASGSGQKTMEVSTRVPTEEEIAEQPINEAKRKMIIDKLDTLRWSFESVFPKCKSWEDIKEGRFKEIIKFLDEQISKRNLK